MQNEQAEQADRWGPPGRRRGPLSGLKVVEFGEGVSAPYCAKLLGDLGAEVVKVERPGGDPSRHAGCFDDVCDDDGETSALFLYLNTSKRSLVLDLALEQDRETFRALVSRADVLIEDQTPGGLETLGLGYEALSILNPGLTHTAVTPFGQTGPKRLHKSRHLNLYHGAGHASPFSALSAERAPSCAGGRLGEYDVGLTAAVGTLAALLGRAARGRGEYLDVSAQEAMMCLERVTIGRYANESDPFASSRGPGGLTRARDGFVMLTTLEKHQWEGLVRAMGNPAWAEAEWTQTPQGRMEHFDEIAERKGAWAADLDRETIYHAAQGEGTPAAPVQSVAEVLAWRQTEARGFFREFDHPRAGCLRLPTAPYVFSKSSWVGTRAPLLGEHEQEIRAELGAAASVASRELAEASVAQGKGPLAGIRVADFTWAWAGPQGSLLLRMLGAEVIKIESQARLDHSRIHSLTAGSMRGGIDESPVFNDLNLGKRSVTLNLRSEGGRDLVRKLVAESDVVLQNMRPGVLDRLGLGYKDLCEVRPDLIMLSSSAVGATGPEGNYAGYAPTFACLSGIASISGHPDQPPEALSGSVDLRVGTASAFAVLSALYHRRRSGEGQDIDLSSTEVMSAMMGHSFVEYQLSGVLPDRQGNRDATMAPHGCYRTSDEAWVTIAVDGEDEWRSFRESLGVAALEDAKFASGAARKANEDDLDLAVGAWTRERTSDAIVSLLQSAGIAAARLHTGATLAHDPHLRERGVYETVEHPRLGKVQVVRPPWRMGGVAIPGPAPLIGQHNDYVLGELLGLGSDEVRRLEQEQAVY